MIDLNQCSLGIELGSTRIKAVFVGDTCKPVAQGDFTWENRLENGIWTYPLEEVWQGSRRAWLGCGVLVVAGRVWPAADHSGVHWRFGYDAWVSGV